MSNRDDELYKVFISADVLHDKLKEQLQYEKSYGDSTSGVLALRALCFTFDKMFRSDKFKAMYEMEVYRED